MVLGLLFISAPSYADDISDFQIEGMSIGDSALDYFTKDEMEKYKSYYPKSKKWVMFAKSVSSFETYDSIQVHFKDGDSKYIIGTLDGSIHYKNNIKDCYKKMDEIVEELTGFFKDVKKSDKKTVDHAYDKSGKSKITFVDFIFKSGDSITVECVDWSKELSYTDKLSVGLTTKKLKDWLNKDKNY